jgi:hypothetical protein
VVTWVFTDKNKEVKRVPVQVEGRLGAGEIKAFTLTVPDCPAFGAYSYEVEFQQGSAEQTFPPVNAEVAAGRAGVTRLEVAKSADGTLHFTATVRSRAPHDVTAVNVTFTLLGGAGGKAVVGQCAGGADKLAAGGSLTIKAELAKPPKFATYTFNTTYTEPTPPKQ